MENRQLEEILNRRVFVAGASASIAGNRMIDSSMSHYERINLFALRAR